MPLSWSALCASLTGRRRGGRHPGAHPQLRPTMARRLRINGPGGFDGGPPAPRRPLCAVVRPSHLGDHDRLAGSTRLKYGPTPSAALAPTASFRPVDRARRERWARPAEDDPLRRPGVSRPFGYTSDRGVFPDPEGVFQRSRLRGRVTPRSPFEQLSKDPGIPGDVAIFRQNARVGLGRYTAWNLQKIRKTGRGEGFAYAL